jgi:hypothetical protein
MPPKKKGGGAKKAKKVEYDTSVEACAPFGFLPNDIVETPLGLKVVIVGVKLAKPDDPTTGRLWAMYSASCASPLGPKSAEEFAHRGFRRASLTEHILRDHKETMAKIERIKQAGIKALMPKPPKDKKKDGKNDGKKKK